MRYIILLVFISILGVLSCQNLVTKSLSNDSVEIFCVPYDTNTFIEMDKHDLLKFDFTKKYSINNIDTISILIAEIRKTIDMGSIDESEPDIRLMCQIKSSHNEMIEFYIDHHRYIFMNGKKYQRSAKIIEIIGQYTGEY